MSESKGDPDHSESSIFTLPDQPHTIAAGGKRVWVYPMEISGRWMQLRQLTGILLLLLFYGAPWFEIGGKPLLLLSFTQGSFVLIGQTILMQEFYHFVLLFLLLVTTLFAASALWGRVWCGYACPQTIFIEHIFLRIERLIEGPALHRRTADLKPWGLNRASAKRAIQKILKQSLFILICASFGLTATAIFVGQQRAFWPTELSVILPVVILTALAWFDGAYWREQFCQIVCPYGRFQGVMQDRATRTIGYDAVRGEPRKRGKSRDGAGDCIDCGLCTRVCPAAIDIRRGPSQIECVACARCIDACDSIMTSVGKPTGLIRYDALEVFEQAKEGKKVAAPSWLRPRMVIYAVVWSVLLAFGISEFVRRKPFHVNILSAGTMPYFVTNGTVKNMFTLKIGNQSTAPQSYELRLSPASQQLFRLESPNHLAAVEPGKEGIIPVLVVALSSAAQTATIEMELISSPGGYLEQVHRGFVAPNHDAHDAVRDQNDHEEEDHEDDDEEATTPATE